MKMRDCLRKPRRKGLLMSTVIALISASFGASGFAADYHVDYLSGSDTNNGLSESSPRRTIPTLLAAGDTVYLKRGVTYGQDYRFTKSGTEKAAGVDGTIDADGITFRSASIDFQSSGVTVGDGVYINGEGFFQVKSIPSAKTIVLAGQTKHRSIGNVAFSIARYITLTVKEGWGVGQVMIGGTLRFDACNGIRIDGKGIMEIANLSGSGLYAATSSRNIVLQGMYLHDVGLSGNSAAIYLANSQYALIEGIRISNIGVDDNVNGDDGIRVVSDSRYVTMSKLDIDHTNDDGIQMAACDVCYVQETEIKNCFAPSVHSDGIQTNQLGGPAMDVTVRYCEIHDNANNFMLEDAKLTFYSNNVYSTGTVGNYGMLIGQLCSVKIFNNIFSNNTYGAIRIHATSGLNPSPPTVIRNNIFFDNSKTGQTNTAEISVDASAIDANSHLDHNIYVRKATGIDGDKIISWGTAKTLQESKAQGQDVGSKKCTSYGCDWSWQNPPLFKSENKANPNFAIYSFQSPQVDAASAMDAPAFDITGNPVASTPDIGSFQKPNPPAGLISR